MSNVIFGSTTLLHNREAANFIKQEPITSDLRTKSEFIEHFHENGHHLTTPPEYFKTAPIEGNSGQKASAPFFHSLPPVAPNTILITNNYNSQDDPSKLISGISNTKLNSSITIVTNSGTGTATTQHDHLHLHHHPTAAATTTNTMPNSTTTTSTVVLDRINICINNHFSNDGKTTTTTTANNNVLEAPHHKTSVEEVVPLKPQEHEPERRSSQDSWTTTSDDSSDLLSTHPDFANGQDVLVQRKDARFYLGTIIALSDTQCLVKFDDNSVYWANFDEVKKLNPGPENSTPMCVACKKVKTGDVVEVCERCGRGYHRGCSGAESSTNSESWNCPRCTLADAANKKLDCSASDFQPHTGNFTDKSQLPYDLDILTWDSKHRVNEEQIYCYCGKNGKWDLKMLQCCKCQQWFHGDCVSCLNYPLYSGDRFYVFGCSICNDGNEFLRRLEMKWIDLVHLILFNLTLNNNWKKYHHLRKDIVTFAVFNWASFQLHPKLRNLTETEIKESISRTLNSSDTRFQCGKEIKKNFSTWALRKVIPPPAPFVVVPPDVKLTDQYLTEKAALKIIQPTHSKGTIPSDAETSDTSDHKFTSDDEIPIKHIIAKEINEKSTLSDKKPNDEKIDSSTAVQAKATATKERFKHSRKRKAPTPLTTLRQEFDDEDDSSDETTSSRGTLDLMIPPLKNYRGRNNPFRIISPKKTTNDASSNKIDSSNYKKSTLSSSSILATAGDLSTKLAALKKSGLFRNSSTSELTQAAAGQYRMIRTVKRRLSANDIIIGPNQEVKRRRLKKKSTGKVEVISTTTIRTIPTSAAYLPIRPSESKNIPISTIRSISSSTITATTNTSSSNSPLASTSPSSAPSTSNSKNLMSFNGRRLRQRPEKPSSSTENSRRNSNSSTSSTSAPATTAPVSPNDTGEVSMSDLKSSVNKYFGAVNRIENGENFTLRAKRVLPSGETQYLIEWET